MRTLSLVLDFNEAAIHPMHDFVAEHPEYGPTRLLQWNPRIPDRNALLLHVAGPREPFLSVHAQRAPAEVVESSGAAGTDGFYLFVSERLEGSARELVGAFADQDVVVAPPVVYDVDGTVRLTIVGGNDALQRAVDRTPTDVSVRIEQIRTGAAGVRPAGESLSDRQREVVESAVELGYYEEPREATVEDVADRVECAPSTAAEHLRKAEAVLVRRGLGTSRRRSRD